MELLGIGMMIGSMAQEIKRRAKKAKEVSFWELGASLLSKGYSFGLNQGWWEVDQA